ncbi:gamma-glutamyltransferase family protein [Alteromonas sp. KUL49]|uniref:gamma-glutamyltransferase family protein n=1 Tax=Alteromonas sp. KUL49 TaxID=2480798 RepID=UPI00102EE027|nr:gamma-glutamyltransferase family protein [Alteromonas sp. KUL49]TAP40228.1 gamma-glutamyltransferase family protein [Alteromonas sp. KUL49]GEA11360.1 gamma-glutamyltranspeptidase [Alteromonas sp. KUL49]
MNKSPNIAFTAPHFAASQVGLDILEKGGTAIEAMVAAAASIAVEYPHMNGLGGDGFWLISEPGKAPIGIDAAGVSAKAATPSWYEGLDAIPSRGPKAALTMAGAVAGWQEALSISEEWQQPLPLKTLLDTAINQATWGIEVTQSLTDASNKTFDDLSSDENFAQFLIKGKALKKGKIVKLPKLAKTLEHLAENGLDDFYRGAMAQTLAADLAAVGSPITIEDFHNYRAKRVTPLGVTTSKGKIYNLPAPTQGVASLIILALYDRVQHLGTTDADMVHLLIECTKQAFIARNANVTDPSRTPVNLESLLTDESLEEMVKHISLDTAQPWPHVAKLGDTIWMGACDSEGRMVSYIQSLYWEFGSGVVSPQTGIVWNNRGTSFSLDPSSNQYLAPGLKPFHTLNPAFAELSDGRRMSYGTMGGEGQPQTQAALFARHIYHNQPIDKAIALGRWLLGRTWGDESHNLKLERDLAEYVGEDLVARGHDTVMVDPCNELMGHAGAVIRTPTGSVSAASDPRSDGKAFVNVKP